MLALLTYEPEVQEPKRGCRTLKIFKWTQQNPHYQKIAFVRSWLAPHALPHTSNKMIQVFKHQYIPRQISNSEKSNITNHYVPLAPQQLAALYHRLPGNARFTCSKEMANRNGKRKAKRQRKKRWKWSNVKCRHCMNHEIGQVLPGLHPSVGQAHASLHAASDFLGNPSWMALWSAGNGQKHICVVHSKP